MIVDNICIDLVEEIRRGWGVILVFNGKGIYDLDLLNLYIRVI